MGELVSKHLIIALGNMCVQPDNNLQSRYFELNEIYSNRYVSVIISQALFVMEVRVRIVKELFYIIPEGAVQRLPFYVMACIKLWG